MVEIFADSCCDLSPEQITGNKIHIIPLYVQMKDETYLDGETILPPQLFEMVKASGVLPKTSAPSMPAFALNFKSYGDSVYIGISSKLSASFHNALLAKSELNRQNIYVIDSLTLSSAIGLLVLKAAEYRDQGMSAEEISTRIQYLVPKTYCSFSIDTLEYLYMGGRCSAMSMVVGSVLKIRPVIEVSSDGTLGVKKKEGGSRKKALQSLLEDFTAKLSEIDLERVFITHTYCDDDAEYLKAELLKIAPIKEVAITHAGATIASHCGPNTIGILYFTR